MLTMRTSLFALFFALLGLVQVVSGHMQLDFPPPLKGVNNPFSKEVTDPDFSLYPYGCCGREVSGPCRGHLDLLGTDEGKAVVAWPPGRKVNLTLSGSNPSVSPFIGGPHYGGSCQVGFSTDKGKTFKVVRSWQGACPHRDGGIDPAKQVFDFTIPADIPIGDDVILSWSWSNREKEFFNSCAVVSISGSGSGSEAPEESSSAAPAPASSAPASSAPASSAPASSAAPEQPSSAPSPSPAQSSQAPEQPPATNETSTTPAQYTLDGCTCACPYQTWSPACSCYSCKSLASKRLAERKALAMHKRHLVNLVKLNAPVRRAETVAWNDRPSMYMSIDFPGSECTSKGGNSEVQYPDPGPDVVEGDGEYPLALLECS